MRVAGRVVAMAVLGVAAMVGADPVCDTSNLIHRWSFNGNLEDSVGGLTATSSGIVRWDAEVQANATQIRICGNGHNTAWVDLGTGLVPAEGGSATFEIWATPLVVQNWSRIIDIGNSDQDYICMTWTQGTTVNSDRVDLHVAGASILTVDNALQPTLGRPYHISLVITPADEGKSTLSIALRDTTTGAILRSGSKTTSAAWGTATVAAYAKCLLGCSMYTGDSDANALYNEVRIWKTALTPEQLSFSARLGPDVLPDSDIEGDATLALTSDNGSVSVNGAAGVGSGSVTLSRKTDATLVATAANGYNFVRWTGDTGRIISGDATSPEITVSTMPGDVSLVAEYESQANAVYAKIENNAFTYLTANKKTALEPAGGMNEGITILFNSDSEYQQLKAKSADVAKSAGVKVDGTAKLNEPHDWTELDYSLGTGMVDINGKALTTKSVKADSGASYAIPLANADFQADWVVSGERNRTAPKGWEVGGGVWLLKNNSDMGDNNTKNGSVWCVTDVGGYIQQKFSVGQAGALTVNYSNSSAVGYYLANSSYAIKVDGATVKSETNIHWQPSARSFTTYVGAGTHTIQFTCTASDTSVKGIEWDNISLNFTPKGHYTSGISGLANGGFEANPVDSGAIISQYPEGWICGGDVRLMKNNTTYGDNNTKNGSVWCVTLPNGYIEQKFRMLKAGSITVNYTNTSAVDAYTRHSSYAIKLDGETVKTESNIHWQPSARSFTAEVAPGVHSIQFTCTGSDNSKIKGIVWDNISISGIQGGVLDFQIAEDPKSNGFVNGNFEANPVNAGEVISKVPEGWIVGGDVRLMKNNRTYGDNNTFNGSVWCLTFPDGYIEQMFRTTTAGSITVNYTNTSAVDAYTRNSSYAIIIDGATVKAETNIHWNPSARSVTTQVAPGLHTIRFTCTGSSSGIKGIVWDNISISGASCGLEVITPTVNNEVPIAGGANLMVVKSGTGTFLANKSGQAYSGGTLVMDGELMVGNNTALGSASEVTVDPDGILELNGKGDIYNYSFVLNGGVLQNTVADLGEGTAQIAKLRLTADSTFIPYCSYGLIGSGYAATTLDLAGHTLTVPIGTGKKFYLFNTTVTAGTLDVSGDGWLVADKTAVNASAADLLVNSALDIRVPFTAGSYEALYTGNDNAGAQPISVQRTFKPHSSAYHGVTLMNNATIDLTACPETLNTPSRFTSGANEFVLQAAEVVTPLQSIESTGTQWIDTGYVCTANTRIEASINTCSRSQAWGVLFGVTGGDRSSDGVLLRYYNDTTTLNGWFCNAAYEEAQVENLQGQDVEVVLEANKMTLNGVEKAITTSATPYASPLYLFCGNNAGSAWRHQSMRLYSMKISEGGVLKRDFVPGRNRDGVVGLWDRVESKFYANKGSGTFTAVEISDETPEPYVLPTNLSIELHGRALNFSKILGWNGIPSDVNFTPTEATRNDHVIFDVRADGLYVPRNTVIYFR